MVRNAASESGCSMKTAELTGALLDYWVARAEGYLFPNLVGNAAITLVHGFNNPYAPSVNWCHGGPIIERKGIILKRYSVACWDAGYGFDDDARGGRLDYTGQEGPTPLI